MILDLVKKIAAICITILIGIGFQVILSFGVEFCSMDTSMVIYCVSCMFRLYLVRREMSRYTITKGHQTLAYGKDHVLGLFITIYDTTSITDDNDEGIVLDLNYMNKVDFAVSLLIWGASTEHIDKALRDLDL
jgi:hypothetical protein